jgi:hypothetical protein
MLPLCPNDRLLLFHGMAEQYESTFKLPVL